LFLVEKIIAITLEKSAYFKGYGASLLDGNMVYLWLIITLCEEKNDLKPYIY